MEEEQEGCTFPERSLGSNTGHLGKHEVNIICDRLLGECNGKQFVNDCFHCNLVATCSVTYCPYRCHCPELHQHEN